MNRADDIRSWDSQKEKLRQLKDERGKTKILDAMFADPQQNNPDTPSARQEQDSPKEHKEKEDFPRDISIRVGSREVEKGGKKVRVKDIRADDGRRVILSKEEFGAFRTNDVIEVRLLRLQQPRKRGEEEVYAGKLIKATRGGVEIYPTTMQENEAQQSPPIQEGTPQATPQETIEPGVSAREGQNEIFGEARRIVREYEVFKGEKMDENQFRNLRAFIEDALQKESKRLVDKWISENPDEVKEASYGTGDLDDKAKLELVLQKEGEGFLENEDPYYRSLAVALAGLERSEGRPEGRTAFFALTILDEAQRDLATRLRSNTENGEDLRAEQVRIFGMQKALFKSLYRKEVGFDEARAKQSAINDSRAQEDLDKYLHGLTEDQTLKLLQAQIANKLTLEEIGMLRDGGYEIVPLTKGWLRKKPVGYRITKDGAEVNTTGVSNFFQQFPERKKEEFAERYLSEHAAAEKIRDLGKLAVRDFDEIERLSEDLERETVAKVMQRLEMAKLRKEDPDQAKAYKETLKENGENVSRMLGNTLEGGEQYGLYRTFDPDNLAHLQGLARYYGRDTNLFSTLGEEDKNLLRSSQKAGPLRFVFTVFRLLSKFEQKLALAA